MFNYKEYLPKSLTYKFLVNKLSCKWKACFITELMMFLLSGGRPMILFLCIWWKLDVMAVEWNFQMYIFWDSIADWFREVYQFCNGMVNGIAIGIAIGIALTLKFQKLQSK